MKKIISYLLVTISLLLNFSCTPTKNEFSIRIDAISANSEFKSKKYILLSGNKSIKDSDLQFKEFKNLVNKALQNSGYQIVKSKNDAEILIFLNYAISYPKEYRRNYVTPIIGQTGISSSHTTGTTTNIGGYGQYSSTTTYTPSYGVTGYVNNIENYIIYTRTLILNAVDKKDSNNEIWKITAISDGSNDDLRVIFPVMVVAIEPYIGKNSGQKITVNIPEDDERILRLKGE